MEFTHTFRVPVDVDTTFETLTDLERVAPCLPGATLEEVDGDAYSGRVKVRVGPIAVTYRGTARMTEVDREAHRARIEASGREARGSGTAEADVVATLEPDGDGTNVTVVTDLNITGKPAQFGRGVMADVGNKIIGAFAERLEAMLTEDEQVPAASEAEPAPGPATAAAAGGPSPSEPAASGAPGGAGAEPAGREAATTGATAAGRGDGQAATAPAGGPRRIAPDPSREDDALNLVEMAGAATIKRLLPVAALAALAIGIVWWLRRR